MRHSTNFYCTFLHEYQHSATITVCANNVVSVVYGQNGNKPKRRIAITATPKWQQTRMATLQYEDQNGDKLKRRQAKTVTQQYTNSYLGLSNWLMM